MLFRKCVLGFSGTGSLGRLRHTWTVCEKGFTERTGAPRAVLISIIVDVMTPAILHGGVSPGSPSRGDPGEWIILFAETTCVADARDVRGELDARVVD